MVKIKITPQTLCFRLKWVKCGLVHELKGTLKEKQKVLFLLVITDNCKLGVILLENKYHKCSSLVIHYFYYFQKNSKLGKQTFKTSRRDQLLKKNTGIFWGGRGGIQNHTNKRLKLYTKVLKTFHNNVKRWCIKIKKKHTYTTLGGFSSCPNQLSRRISQT